MEVANRRVLAALAQDEKVVIFVCMAGVSDPMAEHVAINPEGSSLSKDAFTSAGNCLYVGAKLFQHAQSFTGSEAAAANKQSS